MRLDEALNVSRIAVLEKEGATCNAKLREAVNEIAYKAYNMAHGPTISGICDKALRGGEEK